MMIEMRWFGYEMRILKRLSPKLISVVWIQNFLFHYEWKWNVRASLAGFYYFGFLAVSKSEKVIGI